MSKAVVLFEIPNPACVHMSYIAALATTVPSQPGVVRCAPYDIVRYGIAQIPGPFRAEVL